MTPITLIAIFIALHTRDALGPTGSGAIDAPPWAAAVTALGTPLLAWLLLQTLTTLSVRALDRTGRFAVLLSTERFAAMARIVVAVSTIFATFSLGWLNVVRSAIGDWIMLDELAAVAPAILFFIASWWSMYPLDVRVREAMLFRTLQEGGPLYPTPTRGGFVIGMVRHQMLLILVPVTLIGAWQETLESLSVPLHKAAGSWSGLLQGALEWTGILFGLLATPMFLRYFWDTVPIGKGPLADRVAHLRSLYKVRIAGPLLWRTQGTMVNAAVMGLVYPFRFLLFTDALLERLTAAQVEAVLAHEIAHVHKRHLLWLGLSVIGVFFTSAWLLTVALALAQVPEDSNAALLSLALPLISAGVAFGLISRRFEWQADAFAVAHISRLTSPDPAAPAITPEAVQAMNSALFAVADLNGIPLARFTYRHGSIAQRQRRLARLVGAPANALPIDRACTRVKFFAGILFLLGTAPLLLAAAAEVLRLSSPH